MPAMGFGRNLVRNLKEKIVDRYGEKLVSSIADTSSDAPSRFAAPKRNKYEELEKDGKLGDKKADR
jgi:hypothetical protein